MPEMETPLHGATAMQEMVFQSWGGRLRCFPAVPSIWTDVKFVSFRGEGGFLVSASRRNALTDWIEVAATRAGAVQLETGMDASKYKVQRVAEVNQLQRSVFTLKMTAGSVIRFESDQDDNEPAFVPQTIKPRDKLFRFGLN